MSNNSFTCNKYLAQGKSHIKNNVPCQDYCDYYIDEDSSMIALSDGAGSCKYSHYGSKLIVEKTLGFFKERKKILLDKNEEDIKKALMSYLFKELESKAAELNVPEKELSATLLFVFCYQDKFIYGHIGDGIICCDYDGKLKLVSKGIGGEHKNETVFFRTGIDSKYLTLSIKSLKNILSFYCFSDGLEPVLISNKDSVLADVLQTFSLWMYKYSDNSEYVAKNLKHNLDEIAADDHNIHDDLSLIIMNINNDENKKIRDLKERIYDPFDIKIEKLTEDINSKVNENTEVINKKIDKSNEEITNLKNNIDELKETIKLKDNEISELKKNIEKLNSNIKNYKNDIDRLINSKIDQNRDEILKSNKNIDIKLNDINKNMNKEFNNVYNTLYEKLRNEIDDIIKKYISSQNNDILSSQKKNLNSFADELNKKGEEAINAIKNSINGKKKSRIDYITLIPIYAIQIGTLVLLLLSLFK